MNTKPSSSPAAANADAADRGTGEAGGQHQGLRQPADDQNVEDKLDQVDLQTRGDEVEDRLRDSRSKGVQGGYDDSVGHDADQGYVAPDADGRPRGSD